MIFYMQIETDEDVLWKPDIREENKDIAARGVKFMNWWISAILINISMYLIFYFDIRINRYASLGVIFPLIYQLNSGWVQGKKRRLRLLLIAVSCIKHSTHLETIAFRLWKARFLHSKLAVFFLFLQLSSSFSLWSFGIVLCSQYPNFF